ncbi:MAG: glycoside hydrolase domain-containing protein [Mangrovibacterium sp.]
MKTYIRIIYLLFLFQGCMPGHHNYDGESQYVPFSPDGIPFSVADSAWNVDMRGNHRAVVHVGQVGQNAVKAILPWRRPDLRPETKKIIVTDAATGKEIRNVVVLDFSSESGTIAFQPQTIPGDYYIYYLPYKFRKGWNDARYGKPWNDYLPPEYEAGQDWVDRIKNNPDVIPLAEIRRIESRSQFDFFTSMGLIATQKEIENLKAKVQDDFLTFPEDRAFPIRLTTIPVRWVEKGPSSEFEGTACRNEYYTWQTGVWAITKDLEDIAWSCSDFIYESGKGKISKKDITCFNLEGTNWDGNPVTFNVNVPQGKVQALWFGMQIPEDARPGRYEGEITIAAKNCPPKIVKVKITVTSNELADKGDGDLWRHSRLRWLNSTIGTDSLPVEPYQKMQLNDSMIVATGKEVIVGKNGFISSVRINGKEVFSRPFEFIVETGEGQVALTSKNRTIQKDADGLVSWHSDGISGQGIQFDCEAYMEYDGYIHYRIRVRSEKAVTVRNIKLVSCYTPDASGYFMGAGYKGGFRPENYTWDWKGPWDSYWIGGDKAGLHVELRGGSYHGPLLNDYKPAPPASWANEGEGRIKVKGGSKEKAVVEVSTGKRDLSSDAAEFEFAFLITPVKPVDTHSHFSQRYYHADAEGFDAAAKEGANIINIHHSGRLNPVINYPFIVRDSLISYINRQHANDRKVKLYYTIRELSNYTTEIFALKSLNHEIFVSGVGYGLPWHCEHLIDDYKPAWYTELPGQNADAALVLNGFSRWINYYLEGLRWMFENYKIDGIYMDDVSFDRTVMKRLRKIMAAYRPGSVIDLHSNTAYSIGPANQYTGFFPYVDRLWFGESFKYNQMMPDEWFVTFSGIPFGVMSEMLQDGGNRYLGMVYGATARHSYGPFSPVPVWGLWKRFGITEATMAGYWENNCPVQTSHPNVKATAFMKKDSVLISIGNFDPADQQIKLTFNWLALGIDPAKAILKAPEVENFQAKHVWSVKEAIPVKNKEGLLLILKEK